MKSQNIICIQTVPEYFAAMQAVLQLGFWCCTKAISASQSVFVLFEGRLTDVYFLFSCRSIVLLIGNLI